jgi:hypothetical protein
MPKPGAKITVGNRFGTWTVVEVGLWVSENKGRRRTRAVLLRCDCGTLSKPTPVSELKNRKCCQRCNPRATTHGLTNSPTWNSWCNMRSRVQNPNHHQFKNYGGRGITMDPRWESFEQFLADMGSRPTPKHTLDRIDNDGPYAPENCHWATPAQQARNRRTNRLICHQGRTQTLSDWAHETGIHKHTIRGRLNRGWPVEKALTVAPGSIKGNRWSRH